MLYEKLKDYRAALKFLWYGTMMIKLNVYVNAGRNVLYLLSMLYLDNNLRFTIELKVMYCTLRLVRLHKIYKSLNLNNRFLLKTCTYFFL